MLLNSNSDCYENCIRPRLGGFFLDFFASISLISKET
jgi:hypothetical protein